MTNPGNNIINSAGKSFYPVLISFYIYQMKFFFSFNFARSVFIGKTARYEINFFPLFTKKETTKMTFLYMLV